MDLNKNTVLFIDDDYLNLSLFEIAFKANYNVIVLPSTRDAISILENNKVKVIVADHKMPEETGIDFFRRINPSYPDIIKIIFTAYSSEQVALEAIEADVDKFILKPWKEKELRDSIDSGIREFDLRQKNKDLIDELQKTCKKLTDNENKFHVIFSNSNDGKYIIDLDNNIVEYNPAFLSIIGFNNQLVDSGAVNSFVKSQYPVLISKPLEIYKNSKETIATFEITSISNEKRYLEVNSNKISLNESVYIVSIIRDITERKTFEKRIVETIIKTQEEDQNRYARELHDGLGPLLSTLKMHLEWLESVDDTSENKEKVIKHAIFTLDLAIKNVKEIANNLSPHILQRFGLIEAITSYVDRIKDTCGIEFYIQSEFNQRIKSEIEHVLYRSILECINNSVKHSQAKKIIIKFKIHSGLLTVECSDDGKGFDVDYEMSAGRGMGLFNILSRIEHINGNFSISSKRDFGTCINIKVNVMQ